MYVVAGWADKEHGGSVC